MAMRHTDEFRREAVRIATTSGLTRPQVSSDLGVGLSTLNKWVQKHPHDDLMSGPHEDAEKENERLRKEIRVLREEREVPKNRPGLEPACARWKRLVLLLRDGGQRPFAYCGSLI
jgi:transposase